jgi:tetratricopeptide (TPR) repeat protein
MTTDIRNTPVSTGSPAALEAFEKALLEFQTYSGDPIATLDAALENEPDFVLGHLAKAGLLMTTTEKRYAEFAATALAEAEKRIKQANSREQMLARAVRKLVDMDWHAASATLDELLVEYPRDAFALQLGHTFDFMLGNALNLRNRVTRVMPHWSPAVPGYSYVLGMHAFGLEECNQYADAERAANLALSIQPRDPWAVHALAHVLEMQGRVEEGIREMELREQDWSDAAMLAPHNWWHLGLFYLDRGNVARVLEIYDKGVFVEPRDLTLIQLDCTAMLWRLFVLGYDFGERMRQQADLWQAKLELEAGNYAFNDTHAMMAFAATGREDAATALLRRMEATAHGDDMRAMMAREVGLNAAKAMLAFARQDYASVIEQLMPVRDVSSRFGGSHAQRDVLTLTLIEAAIRGNRQSLARHLLAERTVAKTQSALGWRLLTKAN